MKLTSAMVRQTLDQFEAQPIPDNNPVVPELNKLFGDHTFFLDDNGLNIVEPAAADSAKAPEWQVVKVASWQDAGKTSLTPHEPEPTDVVIALGPGSPETAA
ncbi:MAG TPA: hypothetical protein VGM07_17380 [Stellaceae bacterium]|jgi:hypothetical protein